MTKFRLILFTLLIFSTSQLLAQDNKWKCDFSLGASMNAGNVNNCNLSNSSTLTRNDSIIAMEIRYKVLLSALIPREDIEQNWKLTNFEVNGGIKLDLYQYGLFSPFLACEMVTNRFKGYDFKVSGLIGVKYRIYTKPSISDYSISAALVYDRTEFTDTTTLPTNNFRVSIRPKIKQKITENLTLIHTTFYQPSFLDMGDCIVHSTTKLETRITKMLSLDLSFSYEYRSRLPSNKYKKHDFLTELSLKIKI